MYKLIKEAPYLVPATTPRGQIEQERLQDTKFFPGLSKQSPLCNVLPPVSFWRTPNYVSEDPEVSAATSSLCITIPKITTHLSPFLCEVCFPCNTVDWLLLGDLFLSYIFRAYLYTKDLENTSAKIRNKT